jgi:hypothetical protein
MFTQRVAPEAHGAYVTYAQRVRALRDAGYEQLAFCLVPGHESALGDWARVVVSI